jgi:hypothetical protein
MIYFVAGLIGFVIGSIIVYNIMRGEIDEAWGVAGRMGSEKEHYRLKYEHLKERKGT